MFSPIQPIPFLGFLIPLSFSAFLISALLSGLLGRDLPHRWLGPLILAVPLVWRTALIGLDQGRFPLDGGFSLLLVPTLIVYALGPLFSLVGGAFEPRLTRIRQERRTNRDG
jgi:hypothetical protein